MCFHKSRIVLTEEVECYAVNDSGEVKKKKRLCIQLSNCSPDFTNEIGDTERLSE